MRPAWSRRARPTRRAGGPDRARGPGADRLARVRCSDHLDPAGGGAARCRRGVSGCLNACIVGQSIVLDCQCHTFDDVEIALCRVIAGMTRQKAHQHAWEIHTTGASVVARAPKERAEHYQEQLAARGLRVTIEPD
ncbi:MAG: ATP-dependent Clp protease adaptor ClpS [Chloroflexi bacterium]|nr:ATP-dependent Clp protease adaptor ClpS [Chloroflexota bacterium]